MCRVTRANGEKIPDSQVNNYYMYVYTLITIFRSITMLCGTYIIPQTISLYFTQLSWCIACEVNISYLDLYGLITSFQNATLP